MTSTDNPAAAALENFLVDPEGLPSPSTSVLSVIRAVEDPDASVNDVARLIETDVALAVQLLKVANSALYAPEHPISSVKRAVTTLGFRSVRMLALAASMRSLVPASTDVVDMDEVRRRMVLNATLAREFAAKISPFHQEEAFLAGLLTGLGPVVMALKQPELCQRVLDITGRWPNPGAEASLLGFTSNEITTFLIRRWGMPEALCDSLAERVAPFEEGQSALTQILRLSMLAEDVLCGIDRGSALTRLLAATEAELGLSASETEQWLIEIEPLVDEAAESLQLDMSPSEAYSTLLLEATTRMQALAIESNSAVVSNNRALERLAAENQELKTDATTDFLTRLPNRAMFEEMFATVVNDNRSPVDSGRTTGLLLLDLDHFKSINDTFGHVAGDNVLRAIGALLERQTRGHDLPARFGGEEFVVLLRQTNRTELSLVAERLRRAVSEEVFVLDDGRKLQVTVSIGGALLDEVADDSRMALLERADKRLYVSKHQGRNRCTVD